MADDQKCPARDEWAFTQHLHGQDGRLIVRRDDVVLSRNTEGLCILLERKDKSEETQRVFLSEESVKKLFFFLCTTRRGGTNG